jgi:hypothetical protein
VLVEIATGEGTVDNRSMYPRDRLTAFDRLQSMVEEITGQTILRNLLLGRNAAH